MTAVQIDLNLDLEALNAQFSSSTPQEIIKWAWDLFGAGLAATSSFQSQSLPLLHIISHIAPQTPILFLDTGFHFPETILFRDQLMQAWGLNIQTVSKVQPHAEFLYRYGQLHQKDPDLCCFINKVEPLRLALANYSAWITGIRGDQTNERKGAEIISRQKDGRYKICPMRNWTKQMTWRYIHEQELPDHPLLAQGYMSVGCAPCTRPVLDGEDDRAGRWANQTKKECGIHTQL